MSQCLLLTNKFTLVYNVFQVFFIDNMVFSINLYTFFFYSISDFQIKKPICLMVNLEPDSAAFYLWDTFECDLVSSYINWG